jgi:ABC-type multidrug transport system fused ATPase/permease subunit
MDEFVPVFIVAIALGMVCFIAWVILEIVRSRHRIRAASELQGKLIDRLNSADIGPFAMSESGARLMRAFSEQPAAADAAHVRILRALQSGLVLLTVGVSLFFYSSTRTLPLEGEDVVDFFATLCAAVGVGLLLAAGASYRLSRRLGLLKATDGSSASAVV